MSKPAQVSVSKNLRLSIVDGQHSSMAISLTRIGAQQLANALAEYSLASSSKSAYLPFSTTVEGDDCSSTKPVRIS